MDNLPVSVTPKNREWLARQIRLYRYARPEDYSQSDIDLLALALSAAEEAMAPATQDEINDQLKIFFNGCGKDYPPEKYAAPMLVALASEDIPFDILQAAVVEAIKETVYQPKVADLLRHARPLITDRRRSIYRLQQLIKTWSDRQELVRALPTDAECAEQLAWFKDFRATLKQRAQA